MTGWPFPGDTPVARARRVAQAYRERLCALDPDTCRIIDEMMVGFGEAWVVPRVTTVDPDDVLTPGQAADVLCVSVGALRGLRRRGVVAGIRTDDGWRYVARDILALRDPRHRAVAGVGGRRA